MHSAYPLGEYTCDAMYKFQSESHSFVPYERGPPSDGGAGRRVEGADARRAHAQAGQAAPRRQDPGRPAAPDGAPAQVQHHAGHNTAGHEADSGMAGECTLDDVIAASTGHIKLVYCDVMIRFLFFHFALIT